MLVVVVEVVAYVYLLCFRLNNQLIICSLVVAMIILAGFKPDDRLYQRAQLLHFVSRMGNEGGVDCGGNRTKRKHKGLKQK